MFARGEATPESVRVLDFGLSFCLDEPRLTATVTLVGTPAYMAPEQARGEPATPAADLYSLAATLVHLATGETLYAGSWLDQVDAHTRAPLPDLRARRPELSPAFVRLLAVMLEKNPAQRPANAHDVALALRAIMP
jgi:serine/threonine protein kinase